MPKKKSKLLKVKPKNRFVITRSDIYWWIEFAFFTIWITLEILFELR